jgi:hypothetical protein
LLFGEAADGEAGRVLVHAVRVGEYEARYFAAVAMKSGC